MIFALLTEYEEVNRMLKQVPKQDQYKLLKVAMMRLQMSRQQYRKASSVVKSYRKCAHNVRMIAKHYKLEKSMSCFAANARC